MAKVNLFPRKLNSSKRTRKYVAQEFTVDGLDLYQQVWGKISFLPHWIIWDPPSKTFVVNPAGGKVFHQICRLWLYAPLYLTMAYLLLFGLRNPKLNLILNWIDVGVIMLIETLVLLFSWLFHRKSKEIVASANQLGQFVIRHGNSMRESKSSSLGRINWIAVSEYFVVISLAVIPFWVVLGYGPVYVFIRLRLDPFYLALETTSIPLHHEGLFDSWIFIGLVLLLYYLICVEGIRTECLGFLLAIMTTCLTEDTLRILEGVSRHDIVESLRLYRQASVLQTLRREALDQFMTIIMTVGYAIFVLVISCLVLGLNNIPWVISFIYGILAFICIIFLVEFVPRITSFPQESSRMVNCWKYDVWVRERRGDAKLIRKEIKAMRPICSQFSTFRRMDAEARLEYMQSIMQRTIDSCLLLKTGW